MYTYRKLNPNEVIESFGGIDVIAGCADWAVFGPDGKIAKFANPISGKMNRSIFRLKASAKKEAEYQNSLLQK